MKLWGVNGPRGADEMVSLAQVRLERVEKINELWGVMGHARMPLHVAAGSPALGSWEAHRAAKSSSWALACQAMGPRSFLQPLVPISWGRSRADALLSRLFGSLPATKEHIIPDRGDLSFWCDVAATGASSAKCSHSAGPRIGSSADML